MLDGVESNMTREHKAYLSHCRLPLDVQTSGLSGLAPSRIRYEGPGGCTTVLVDWKFQAQTVLLRNETRVCMLEAAWLSEWHRRGDPGWATVLAATSARERHDPVARCVSPCSPLHSHRMDLDIRAGLTMVA